MKFKVGDKVYIDNLYVNYLHVIVTGVGIIGFIKEWSDGRSSMNIKYINSNGKELTFSSTDNDVNYHKIKTPLEYRMMKINKIKERIHNEI